MIKNLPLFFSLLILSCSSDNSFTLNGNIDTVDNTKVYILQADQNNQPFIKDSTTVKSNQFSFKDDFNERISKLFKLSFLLSNISINL